MKTAKRKLEAVTKGEGCEVKSLSKYSDDNIGNISDLPEIIPANVNWHEASYKGKDLLESTNFAGMLNRKNNEGKACLEFKDLMADLEARYIRDDGDLSTYTIARKIYSFAYFIYADEKRADYFTDVIMGYFKPQGGM